jgi:5-methylcytosine-specific restriction enzyme subunit McrC
MGTTQTATSSSMRTIRLREHKSQEEVLSADELRHLVALPAGLLDVSHRPNGSVAIKPRSHVGTIVLPSLRILIRPKVGLRNVFFLLGYANNIRWSAEDFPYEEDDLYRAFAWWFDREAAKAARFGLAREYIDRQEALTTLRGRLALDRQLAARPGRRIPIECRFQDYSEDTPLNQVVKAAHNSLLRVPDLDRELAIRLRHRARQVFGDVSSVEYVSALPAIGLTRLNRPWEAVLHMARLILRRRSIRDERGSVLGAAFTVDMNALFERFVTAVVAERVRGTPYTFEAQARRRLAGRGEGPHGLIVPPVNMRPDLLLKAGSSPVAVADAKYKELLRVGDWEHPDLYQLLAYCVRLGLDRGLLIYAGKRPITESPIVNSPIKLATVGIDLTGTPEEVLHEARSVADAVIEQAERTSMGQAA